MNKLHKAEKARIESESNLTYLLYRFGDHIAKREGYLENQGLEAVHHYLMQKHHWLPEQVRSMHPGDLLFALSEEMSGWTLPKDK